MTRSRLWRNCNISLFIVAGLLRHPGVSWLDQRDLLRQHGCPRLLLPLHHHGLRQGRAQSQPRGGPDEDPHWRLLRNILRQNPGKCRARRRNWYWDWIFAGIVGLYSMYMYIQIVIFFESSFLASWNDLRVLSGQHYQEGIRDGLRGIILFLAYVWHKIKWLPFLCSHSKSKSGLIFSHTQ